MQRKAVILTAISIGSTLYFAAGVTLLIVAVRTALKQEPVQAKQEPASVWVLHVEEALSQL
jgi:hypothetical protein